VTRAKGCAFDACNPANCQCRLRVDTVEKVFLRPEQIFPEALARPSKKLFRGTHDQSDFQPAVFVSSPEGAGLWNAGFDRRARTSFGQFVFGFFDSIDP
jgi:hypothetical protein